MSTIDFHKQLANQPAFLITHIRYSCSRIVTDTQINTFTQEETPDIHNQPNSPNGILLGVAWCYYLMATDRQ